MLPRCYGASVASLVNFEAQIHFSEQLLVIDFYASWCMPCKQIGGEIDRLSTTAPYNDTSKIAFYKCDVEVVEEVQEHYSISVSSLAYPINHHACMYCNVYWSRWAGEVKCQK